MTCGGICSVVDHEDMSSSLRVYERAHSFVLVLHVLCMILYFHLHYLIYILLFPMVSIVLLPTVSDYPMLLSCAMYWWWYIGPIRAAGFRTAVSGSRLRRKGSCPDRADRLGEIYAMDIT